MLKKATEYIKGRDLPPYLVDKYALDPEKVFKITIEAEDRNDEEKELAFKLLDEVQENMNKEDQDEIEKIIDEAITVTRKNAQDYS